jgi:hypothetical protein
LALVAQAVLLVSMAQLVETLYLAALLQLVAVLAHLEAFQLLTALTVVRVVHQQTVEQAAQVPSAKAITVLHRLVLLVRRVVVAVHRPLARMCLQLLAVLVAQVRQTVFQVHR